MLIACWSVKGGSGTSVVAAALGLVLAARVADDVLLVDLAGELPVVLGVGVGTERPGVADWLGGGSASSPSGDADALRRLEVDVVPGLRLLPAGGLPFRDDASADALLAVITDGLPAGVRGARPVVVDAGVPVAGSVGGVVAAAASMSLLVLRPCYLALRRALDAPVRPSGVVLVDEFGRALGARDVQETLGVPVVAVIRTSPEVARAVDAGLSSTRLPRSLARPLRRAVAA